MSTTKGSPDPVFRIAVEGTPIYPDFAEIFTGIDQDDG